MKKKKKNKQELSYAVTQIYRKMLNLLGAQRLYIGLVFLCMLIFFFVGMIYPELFRTEIETIINSLVSNIEGKDFSGIASFIIWNNIKSTFISIVFGITIVLPLMSVAMNGYIIGFVASDKIKEAGALIFLKILPHGIFEIPALCIAVVFGVRIGIRTVQRGINLLSFGKIGNKRSIKKAASEALMIYLFIIVPLLIIAGLIETMLIFFTI